MAIIKIESVVITNSRLAKGFNGDSFNLNGKALSVQNADAGFKAAGDVKPPFYAVIASCNRKGFASGAVTAFNDYVDAIADDRFKFDVAVEKYFNDMDAVIEKCGIPKTHLSIAILYVAEDCVLAARSGGCHILRFSEGELFETALPDDETKRGFQLIDSVTNGDTFALTGEDCSDDLDYDGIVASFDSGGDLKNMIKDQFSAVNKNARGRDCSLALIKIHSDTRRTFAAIAQESEKPKEKEPLEDSDFVAEPPINENELVQNDEKVSDSESPKNGKKSVKKKLLSIIPIAILVIILAVAAALYLSSHPLNIFNREDGSENDASTTSAETVSNDGDFNGSFGMETVGDEGGDREDEEAGDDITPDNNENNDDNNNNNNDNGDNDIRETTTREPETTTREPETTTRELETTTRTPETTTRAPETTTNAPTTSGETTTRRQNETTTRRQDETTTRRQSETTTGRQNETTTRRQQETTAAPTVETTTRLFDGNNGGAVDFG